MRLPFLFPRSSLHSDKDDYANDDVDLNTDVGRVSVDTDADVHGIAVNTEVEAADWDLSNSALLIFWAGYFFVVRGCPMHCPTCQGHSLPHPQVVTIKNGTRHCQMFPAEAKSSPAENHYFILKQTNSRNNANRMTDKKESQMKRSGGCSSEVKYNKDRSGAVGSGHAQLLVALRRALGLDRVEEGGEELYQVCADLNPDCWRTGPGACGG